MAEVLLKKNEILHKELLTRPHLLRASRGCYLNPKGYDFKLFPNSAAEVTVKRFYNMTS